MLELANRNLKLFFKDKTAVLFSLLAEGIVVVLYVLFIRENLLKQFTMIEQKELFMDVWMIAGLLGITPVSTTMGAFGIMVDDRVKNIWKDFIVAPISSYGIIGGYMLAAIFIGLFMSAFVLMLAMGYIEIHYGLNLICGNGWEIMSTIFATTLCSSAMVLFLISFMKSNNALATCCTVVGALVGFLTGIYLPMGNMSDSVQQLIHKIPLSHGAVLFRKSMMMPFLDKFFDEAAGMSLEDFSEIMGISYYCDGAIIPRKSSIIFMFTAFLVFSLLTVARLRNVESGVGK